MKRTNRVLVTGVVMLMGVSMVACGGDSSESAPTSGPTSTEVALTPSDESNDNDDSTSAPETAASARASETDCVAILRFFEENGLFLDSNPDVTLAAELIDGFLNAVSSELRADAEFIVDAYQRMLDVIVANGGDLNMAVITPAGRAAMDYFNNSGRYALEQKIFDYYIPRCPQWQ